MVRNSGKFGKPRRGGGKHFSRDPSKPDGGGPAEKEGMWGDGGGKEDSDEGSEEEDSDDEDSDGEEEAPASGSAPAGKTGVEDRFASASLGNDQPTTVSRADRKAAKKKADEDEDDDLLNPNRGAPKTVKTGDIGKSAQPMSRREREAAEKKAAQERYMKLHLAGKTDQAKSDLARLAQIKAQREAAAATRKAEADAKAKESADRIAGSSRKKQ